MLALTNGVFYTGKGVINDKALLIDGENIVGFIENSGLSGIKNILDLKGSVVSPGYIDIQINGCCDELFSPKSTIETLTASSAIFAKYGTTRWMPTYLSLSRDDLMQLTKIRKDLLSISGLLGVHIEGPWIDERYKGVHDNKNIRKWTNADYLLVKIIANTFLTCVTLSPNKIDKSELELLTKLNNLKVLLGHSSASYEEAMDAFRAGISGVTHILNAMKQPTSRKPSVISAVMENEQIYASIIADMYHIHPAIIKLLKRAFYNKSLFFISDAMPTVGGKERSFSISGNICFNNNGRITDKDGNLAGSAIMLIDAVRNSVQNIGIPMDEALRMATLYPATFLGIDNQYGLLESGYKADITVISNQFKIRKTFRSGELLYESNSS